MNYSLRLDEPMSRHTATRVGGPAEAWVVVNEDAGVAEVLELCREKGWNWQPFGAGTRTVVREAGMSGAIVRLGTGLSTIEPGDRWWIGGGTPMPAVVAAAIRAGKAGLEDRADVPGSFGAALALDPGPWPVEIVRYVHRGRVKEGTLEEARAAKTPWILGAWLNLQNGDPDALAARARMRRIGEIGRDPWTPPGSLFHPPKKIALRALLRKAGVADVRLRSFMLAEPTPEIAVNLGGGTARDLLLLWQSVVERVAQQTGVDITNRVQWAGKLGR